MKTKLLILAISALALAGCDSELRIVEQNATQIDSIYEAYLEDGTRCAIFEKGYSGGLSCDWQGEKKNDK